MLLECMLAGQDHFDFLDNLFLAQGVALEGEAVEGLFHVRESLAAFRRERLVEQAIEGGQQVLVEQFGKECRRCELQARRMCEVWRGRQPTTASGAGERSVATMKRLNMKVSLDRAAQAERIGCGLGRGISGNPFVTASSFDLPSQ
jgi:hypothetical protein